MTELRRIADLGLLAGLNARIMLPDAIDDRLPFLRTDDLAGGLWVDEDGQANPVDVCMAYAKAARDHGVRIYENAPVQTVHARNGAVHAVELTDGRTIRCHKVVNCAGAWARELGARSGVAVPLQAVEHMYVVTEPVTGLPQPWPVVRDLEGRIYIKEDAGKLVLGGFEPDAKLFDVNGSNGTVPFVELPEDWEQFEPFMLAGLNRVPAFSDHGIQHFMNGPESFTPDTRQVMGEAPEVRNYFVAAGFNSIGIISSAGAGKVMADWVADGHAPMDVSDLDIARFEPDMATPAFLAGRVQEAVAAQLDMHWPYKRFETGRDLRRLPAHDVWRNAGAVFGSPAGWERPLWFSIEGGDGGYSYGDQPWWPAAESECLAARDAAVLIDLSPFAKFEISTPDGLQGLCSADISKAADRAVYTQLLNGKGGIEADGTVIGQPDGRYMFVGAAPSRRRDLMWIERNMNDVTVRDITLELAVLALMGPKAADVWAAAGGDSSIFDLPFGGIARTELNDIPILAVRLSFIGEFGCELYLRWDKAADIARRLLAVGEPRGLLPMGLHAVDCCRMEKGFRHWGHDIGPHDTPIEAGLGFSVDMRKDVDFIGRAAVEAQRQSGPARRLLQFKVDGAYPLLLHDEPVYRDGRLAGHTTSGARGFRTGLSLCFAYIPAEPGETITDMASGSYEISVAGKRFPLKALDRPPYDPDATRMRGSGAAS